MINKERKEQRTNDLPMIVRLVCWCLKVYSATQDKRFPTKYTVFQDNIQTIKDGFAGYLTKDENGNYINTLNLSNIKISPFFAKILIGYLVKHNKGVFDRVMIEPWSADGVASSYVVNAYVKMHPEAAEAIKTKLGNMYLEDWVLARLTRYSARLKAANGLPPFVGESR